MYYNVSLLFCEEQNGIYSHLPFASPVVSSREKAEKLFEYELKAYTNNWRGNELIYDKKISGYNAVRQALVKCNEAAYMHGYYLLVLNEWNHNPHE